MSFTLRQIRIYGNLNPRGIQWYIFTIKSPKSKSKTKSTYKCNDNEKMCWLKYFYFEIKYVESSFRLNFVFIFIENHLNKKN